CSSDLGRARTGRPGRGFPRPRRRRRSWAALTGSWCHLPRFTGAPVPSSGFTGFGMCTTRGTARDEHRCAAPGGPWGAAPCPAPGAAGCGGHADPSVILYAVPVRCSGRTGVRSSCRPVAFRTAARRSEEHTSELQSRENIVCRLLLEKKYDENGKISQEPASAIMTQIEIALL